MGVSVDSFVKALKSMNTTVKKDLSDGKPWKYYNNKRSDNTFEKTRASGKRCTNCFGGVAFGLLMAKLVPHSATRWYGTKGGIHFLDKTAEKEFKKYFDTDDISGKKTVKKAIEDGTLKRGDIVTYMGMAHTNVYLGDKKSFDAGHAYCDGNGEGAIYKKWIGDTKYLNYKIAKIVRLKEGEPSKKRKYVGQIVKDCPVRSGPGTKYEVFAAYPELKVGNLIDVCDEKINSAGNTWNYVRIAGKHYAWVYSKRIKRV